MTRVKTAPAASAPVRQAVAEEKPLSDMTAAEILDRWPAQPEKPIENFSIVELVALKQFGPATVGGALYLAAQKTAAASLDARFGPAILSKSMKPVEFVTHIDGSQGDYPKEAA